MATVTGEIRVDAPKEKVWAVLADLALCQEFNPGIKKSYYVADVRDGLGAARHCDFSMGFVEEDVVDWDEGESLSLEVYKLKGMPVEEVKGHYRLESERAGTIVTHWIDYQTKGPLGLILRPITKSMFEKAVKYTLAGLKEYSQEAARAH